MKVIGLTGQARAGKDTVGQLIEDAYYSNSVDPKVVKRTGFAHALKLSVARLFNPSVTLGEALEWADVFKTRGRVVLEHQEDPGDPIIEVSGRQFLQRYGTEAHRDTFGEDFWLDAVLPAGRDDCDLLVITDARFENEVQRIRDRGGEVWRILRPDHENPAEVGAHVSEQAIPDEYVTRTIVNDGTLNDLRAKVLEALLYV